MAKENANLNTVYVGAANPPVTKVLNKKLTGIDGPINETDDVTTDDSTAPEKSTVYAGFMKGLKIEQLVDTADASYAFLDARAKDGATFFVSWRPDGDGSGTKTQGIFSAIVTAVAPKREPNKKARVEWTIDATGGTTWSTQP